jgi:hypothetical protein
MHSIVLRDDLRLYDRIVVDDTEEPMRGVREAAVSWVDCEADSVF